MQDMQIFLKKDFYLSKLDCIPKCLAVSHTLSSKSASSQSLSMKKTSLFSGSGEDWDCLEDEVPRGVS